MYGCTGEAGRRRPGMGSSGWWECACARGTRATRTRALPRAGRGSRARPRSRWGTSRCRTSSSALRQTRERVTPEYHELPAALPVPEDDGAADHLPGMRVPALRLGSFDLAEAARGTLVAFIYPRTGTPGRPSPEGWDDIPGARGCTPQS